MGNGPMVDFQPAEGSGLHARRSESYCPCEPSFSIRSCFLVAYHHIMSHAIKGNPVVPNSCFDEEDLVQEAALKILSRLRDANAGENESCDERDSGVSPLFTGKQGGNTTGREKDAGFSSSGLASPQRSRRNCDPGSSVCPHTRSPSDDLRSAEMDGPGFDKAIMDGSITRAQTRIVSSVEDMHSRPSGEPQPDTEDSGCRFFSGHFDRRFHPLFRCVMRQLRIDLWRKETGSGRYRVLSLEGMVGDNREASRGERVRIGHTSPVSWRSDDTHSGSESWHFEEMSWKEMLQGLDREDKQLLYLRVWMDLGWREVAEIMGLSEAAARTRFMRIKRRIFRSWSDAER